MNDNPSDFITDVRPKPWWSEASIRTQLLDIAEMKFEKSFPDVGSLFVYSENYFDKNLTELTSLKNVNKYFYAMKANNNHSMILAALSRDMGIECVSYNELKTVLAIEPSICGSRILYTPNFASKLEFQAVTKLFTSFNRGSKYLEQLFPFINIDNVWILENWDLSIFENIPLFLRIDSNEEGQGHHAYVDTGKSSKFGITEEELEAFFNTEKGLQLKSQIVGLHMHKGSNISDASQWASGAKSLLKFKPMFPSLKYIDLGGGIGVPYKPTDLPIDLQALDDQLGEVTKDHSDLTFCIEPGRKVAAECGVMLVKVNQLKCKYNHRFVGVSAGMNDLIRPALYDAYHHIVNLTKYHEQYLQLATNTDISQNEGIFFDPKADVEESIICNVVGPICETGDFLNKNIRLPKNTSEGDIILIDTVGAYGKVMSNGYNMRVSGTEVWTRFTVPE